MTHGGVAEILHAIGAVDCKLWRVDAVGVVEAEAGKIGAAGRENVSIAYPERGQCTLEFGIIFCGEPDSTSSREARGAGTARTHLML